MSALSPGLYRATVRGVPNVIVLIDENGYGHHATIIGDSRHSDPSRITDVRPLIVLDLEDHGRVNASNLAQVLREDGYPRLADQLEAQTKPARIPEPMGRGAVVTDGSEFHFPWTRFSGSKDQNEGNWINEDGLVQQWSKISDPTLISEGVIES